MEARELERKARSFVLILVLLSVLALVGCGSSETKVTADQVVKDALAAQAEVSTSHVEITDNASAQGTWNGSALNVSLNGTGNGDIDWANKKMKTHLDQTINYNNMQIPMSADMYVVDNYTYTRMAISILNGDWSKSALPVDLWLTPDNIQFINSILQSTQLESLPEEKVGDINCYVVQLTPDFAAIQQVLSQQFPNQSVIPNLAKLITSSSFKVWVARKTSYVTKVEIALSAYVTPEVLGKTANDDVLDITLSLTMQVTDSNKPVSIELPAEAQNAKVGGFKLPLNHLGF
jgi:outer membrane lipoprotein-sorting protein